MQFSPILAFCAAVATSSAEVYQGFNYGSTFTDGSAITQPGYEARFNSAKNLAGASGFTSARLFTSIQAGTTNAPSDAFQAAIDTKTSLLLGLWASAGQANIDNELAAIQAAIDAHGTQFTDLVVGVSVGSEDLYRISPTGIENNSGVGAGPDEVAGYIGRVKQALGTGGLSGKPVGHVDTWTAYVNDTNAAVISASDFIGVDAYPFYEYQRPNGIENGYSLFFSAYDQTVAKAQGKPVWVTETGWPVSGDAEGQAQAGLANAKTYWDQVGCARLFGKVNTFWFTLQDSFPGTPNPSFGLVGAGSSATNVPTTPLFDLSCSGDASDTPASSDTLSALEASPSIQAAGNNGAQRQNAVEQGGAQDKSSSSSTPAEVNASSSPASKANADSKKQTSSTSSSIPQPEQQSSSGVPQAVPSSIQQTTLITKTSALPSASAQASGCPASVSGQFEYPHLIIPVSQDQPDNAAGTSFNGTISANTSSIYNFDIPTGLEGKFCTLVFLLPKQTELVTSAYTLEGNGGIDVARLKEPATEQTTYNHQPAVEEDLGGPSVVEPGDEYVISGGPCYVGQRKGYKLSATGSLDLNYFQDYNPSPIGLFVTVC